MKSSSDREIPADEEKIEHEIQANLHRLARSKRVRSKNADVLHMISHYIGMTDEIERRRQQLLTFGLTTITFSVAAIAFLVSQIRSIAPILFWPLLMVFVSQVIFSLTLAVWYELQSRFRYPFLELQEYGNQWKWFYRANKHIGQLTVPLFPHGYRKRDPKDILSYLKGLEFCTNNYSRETESDQIAANLLQLYLLQVHNFYKNRFYLQLNSIRKWSYFAILPLFLLTLLGVICFGPAQQGSRGALNASRECDTVVVVSDSANKLSQSDLKKIDQRQSDSLVGGKH